MNFRRWVVFTFLVHMLVVAVDKGGGLVLYLLTANQADQHGKSGIIASLPYILMAVANLGLATSLVYFLGKRRYSPQQVFETTMTVAVVWGCTVALLALWVAIFVMEFNVWLVVPICAAVPVMLVASYGNSLQLAAEQVRGYSTVHLFASVVFLLAFFLVFYLLGGSVAAGDVPMAVAWGRLFSTALVAVLVLWLVRKLVKLRFGLNRDFLREGIKFGWKANLTSTLTYLNHRIDLVVLGPLFIAPDLPLAYAQVGYYGMAVTWAELVWHFPEAMRDLFFSKVAGSSHSQSRELTPVLSRIGLAISVVAGIVLLFIVDPVMSTITWLAGKQGDPWNTIWSEPVRRALVLLTPGTIAFTVSKILQADLAARSKLDICVRAQGFVLVLMLALDLLWIPEHGASGAALASSVAYIASTAYTVWVYARDTKLPVLSCLLMQKSDFKYFREIPGAIRRRLKRSEPKSI
ncbi:MAG: hypothetical protein EXS02_08140 [Planctomycetes bacterium]|nr:hypothetical protein [Planctomycetota bacterium]